jgi:hypothetical protein
LEGELDDARAELETLHAERASQSDAYSLQQSMRCTLLRSEVEKANLRLDLRVQQENVAVLRECVPLTPTPTLQ